MSENTAYVIQPVVTTVVEQATPVITTNVYYEQPVTVEVTIGKQGPQGPPGSGNVFVQEFPPTSNLVPGLQWYNPVTGTLSVFNGQEWKSLVVDGLYF